MAITADDIRAMMQAFGWSQKDLTKRLGLGEGTVSHWLAGRRTPHGIYEREVEKLIAQAGLLRAGAAPGANREELRAMVTRIVAATNPPTSDDASPEQRAYDAGRRETLQTILDALIDAMYLQQHDGGRYTPPRDKETDK